MGMMINRRRVCGGKKLPYDAEVEYLQSSGTQYINTGINISSGDVITLVFQIMGSQSTIFFGSRTSSGDKKCTIGSGLSATIIYATLGNATNTKLINFDQNKHTVTLNTSTGNARIDGGSWISVGTFISNNFNALIFACNQGGTPSLYSSIRVFSVEISGKALFIPVRVGNVGYMYDKVSGQLFGNAGTGEFILGPDK